MHIADEIIKEVEEGKIVDPFSEQDKTKVLLQLKELDLIEISESGVSITEEGKLARAEGIKTYFRKKKEARNRIEVYIDEEEVEKDKLEGKLMTFFPTLIFLILILGLVWMLFSN